MWILFNVKAGGQRSHDSQRVKMEHRGEHHDMKQRPPGYNAHPNASRHDPSRMKSESGHHGKSRARYLFTHLKKKYTGINYYNFHVDQNW